MRARAAAIAALVGIAAVLVSTGCSASAPTPPPHASSSSAPRPPASAPTSSSSAPSLPSPQAMAVHTVTRGSGPRVLVLIHGGPGLGEPGLLDAFSGLTAAGYELVYYDQRGVGGTHVPADGDYSPDAQVADLEALRVRLKASRIDLLGFSWGAVLASLYAAAHPERVGTVITVNGLPLGNEDAQAGLDAFAARQAALQRRHLVPASIPGAVGNDCRPSLAALAPVYEGDPLSHGVRDAVAKTSCSEVAAEATDTAYEAVADAPGPRAQLARWHGHVIIVSGTRDPFGPTWPAAIRAQFHGASVTALSVAGAGHFAWIGHPDLVPRLASALRAASR